MDQQAKSFGYERLRSIEDFRSPIRGFVEYHGLPDFIYEYKERKRAGVELYYLQKNEVFDFIEKNWEPNSVFPRTVRQMYKIERDLYSDMASDKSAHSSTVPPIGDLPNSYRYKVQNVFTPLWLSARSNYVGAVHGKFVVLLAVNTNGGIEDLTVTFRDAPQALADLGVDTLQKTTLPVMSKEEVRQLEPRHRMYFRWDSVFQDP